MYNIIVNYININGGVLDSTLFQSLLVHTEERLLVKHSQLLVTGEKESYALAA